MIKQNMQLLLVLAVFCLALTACNLDEVPATWVIETIAPSATEPAATARLAAATSVQATATVVLTEPIELTERIAEPAGGSGDADVEFVRASFNGETWSFSVTVLHPDTGWEDYADGWDVVLPDGTVLKHSAADPFTRLLLHPHETEQPFTRSQNGLLIPDGITRVTVRAHDIVDGFGGREVVVELTQLAGDRYSVE